MLKLVRYIWPRPYTLLGILLGLFATIMGAKMQFKEHIFAFSGGHLPKILKHLPFTKSFVAITLGHVVLAESLDSQSQFWRHECVHVRQYERWGILFVPAYFLASLWVWAHGNHPYRDNPFECEAYADED